MYAVIIKISMTEYHHLINRLAHSNTTVCGGNEYGISGHLHIFTFSKYLIMLLKCNFFRASFLHPITDTDSMQGHAAQIS